jgi:hypothetical protein
MKTAALLISALASASVSSIEAKVSNDRLIISL